MKLILIALALIGTTSFAAVDNIYTRVNYPQPRLLDNNSRVFPVVVNYTTDGNGTVLPMGPITADSYYYATPIASPVSTTNAVIIKAAVSGTKRNYVSGLQMTNTSATGSVVSIKDGSTVMWSGYIPASSGQMLLSFDPPLKGTASTATNFVVNTEGTSIHVSAQGFAR